MGHIRMELVKPSYADFDFDDEELEGFIEYYADRGIDEQQAIYYYVLNFLKEADPTDFIMDDNETLSYEISGAYATEAQVTWDGIYPEDM